MNSNDYDSKYVFFFEIEISTIQNSLWDTLSKALAFPWNPK